MTDSQNLRGPVSDAEEVPDGTTRLFKLLVSAVGDEAIFAMDPNGVILTWNPGAGKLTGYSAREIIGSNFSRLYSPEDLSGNQPAESLKISARDGTHKEEGWRARKDGSRFWASNTITALYDDTGAFQGFANILRDLTQQNLAEEARLQEHRNTAYLEQLQESERTLDQIFSEAPSFMALLSVPDYRYLKSNVQHQALIRKADFIGKTVREVEPELEAQGIIRMLDEAVRTGRPVAGKEVAVQYAAVNGHPARTAYLDFVYQPLRRPNGEIYAIAAQGYEVTEKVLSRKAVENERENFRNLFRQTPELVCILKGPDHVFEFVNEAHIKVLGFDATGLPVRKAQPESVEVHGILDDVYRTGKTASLHEIPVTVTNRLRHFNLTYSARWDEAGEINGIMILGIEVTDQVEARNRIRTHQERVRESELRYRTLTEALPLLVWGCQPGGECDFLSRQWLEYTGNGNDAPAATDWFENVIHPDDRERNRAHWTGALQGHHPYDIELRIRRHDGVYRWFKTRSAPMRGPDGQIAYWVGTCTDVEDQKRNLEILQTIHEVGRSISAELDLNRLVQAVTDAATRLTGAEFGAFFYNVLNEKREMYTLYTLSGAPREAFSRFPMPRNTQVFAPTFHGTGTVRSDDITKDPRYGKNAPYHGMPEGHLPVVSYLAVPVGSRAGDVLGGLFFGHSKQAVFSDREEELIRGLANQVAVAIDNAKLYQQVKEAVRARDEFLSIASHELRTPLTGMKIQTQMINRKLAKDPQATLPPDTVTQFVGNIDRGLDRLVRLVEDMLDISRIQNRKLSLQLDTVDLGAVITESLDRFTPELATAGIELRTVLAPGVFARVDRFRLEQVLTNLMTNAIRYASRAPVDVTLEQVDDRAIICFQDHGPGISKVDQDRVFGRFERLASADHVSGMGLGLYICKEIVEAHGGAIRVESESGKGARFIVELLTEGGPQ